MTWGEVVQVMQDGYVLHGQPGVNLRLERNGNVLARVSGATFQALKDNKAIRLEHEGVDGRFWELTPEFRQ